MRFEACEMPKKTRGFHPTKMYKLLTEFAKAEVVVARVFDYEHKSVYSATKSINQAAKRFSMTHIHAFTAGGNLYIENKALSEKSE